MNQPYDHSYFLNENECLEICFLATIKFSISILQGCVPDAEKNLFKEWQTRKTELNQM